MGGQNWEAKNGRPNLGGQKWAAEDDRPEWMVPSPLARRVFGVPVSEDAFVKRVVVLKMGGQNRAAKFWRLNFGRPDMGGRLWAARKGQIRFQISTGRGQHCFACPQAK